MFSDVTYFGSDKDGAELSCLLLGYILDCLTKCMIHDTESVFTGDIFNMLMQPLVDQVRLWEIIPKISLGVFVLLCQLTYVVSIPASLQRC